MKKLKVVIAVDSFKGSISSKLAAECIEKGIYRFLKKDIEIKKITIADGGEGTTDSIIEALGGKYEYIDVNDPFGRKRKAKIGFLEDKTVVFEMAEAAGIHLVNKDELNPFITSTFGVGQMIKKALDMDIKKIYIGLGGSATNDGGAGMLSALGVKFYNEDNKEIGYTPKELKNIGKIDFSNLDKRLDKVKIFILSDVNNPLCGKNGASYVYGPQKGATPEDAIELDKILKKYSKIIDNELEDEFSIKPGSGAAGGLGYALLSICSGIFNQGIEEILEITKLKKIINDADLVITGEGRIDNQSINGKAPVGIAKIAKEFSIPVIAIVGSSDRNLDDIYESGIDLVLDIINEPMNLETAIDNVKELLELTGEKAIRALMIGNRRMYK